MEKPLDRLTDDELLTEFREGNDAAFTLLVGRYQDSLTNFTYRVVGDETAALNVVCESFVRFYYGRGGKHSGAGFSTAIHALVIRCMRSFVRRASLSRIFLSRRKKKEPEPLFDIPEEPWRGWSFDEVDRKEEPLKQALLGLPLKSRVHIVLRDVQDLSYDDIAAIAGDSVDAVRSNIVSAREQLQHLLQAEKN